MKNKKLRRVIESIGLDIGNWVDDLGGNTLISESNRVSWQTTDVAPDTLWAAEADDLHTEESEMVDDVVEDVNEEHASVFVPVNGGIKQYIQENIGEYGIDEVAGIWETELVSEFSDLDDLQIGTIVEGNLIHILGEKTYKDLRRDAPNFLRIRDKSRQTPGSTYVGIDENNIIAFKTPSHTHPGVTYDQQVKLLDLEYLIQHYAGIKKPIEIVRLALEGNIEVHCTDPSWKYWGFQYIGTKKNYAVVPEPRYPKIRNPRLKGSVCKHLDNVLFVLPFQNAKIARDLVKQQRL